MPSCSSQATQTDQTMKQNTAFDTTDRTQNEVGNKHGDQDMDWNWNGNGTEHDHDHPEPLWHCIPPRNYDSCFPSVDGTLAEVAAIVALEAIVLTAEGTTYWTSGAAAISSAVGAATAIADAATRTTTTTPTSSAGAVRALTTTKTTTKTTKTATATINTTTTITIEMAKAGVGAGAVAAELSAESADVSAAAADVSPAPADIRAYISAATADTRAAVAVATAPFPPISLPPHYPSRPLTHRTFDLNWLPFRTSLEHLIALEPEPTSEWYQKVFSRPRGDPNDSPENPEDSKVGKEEKSETATSTSFASAVAADPRAEAAAASSSPISLLSPPHDLPPRPPTHRTFDLNWPRSPSRSTLEYLKALEPEPIQEWCKDFFFSRPHDGLNDSPKIPENPKVGKEGKTSTATATSTSFASAVTTDLKAKAAAAATTTPIPLLSLPHHLPSRPLTHRTFEYNWHSPPEDLTALKPELIPEWCKEFFFSHPEGGLNGRSPENPEGPKAGKEEEIATATSTAAAAAAPPSNNPNTTSDKNKNNNNKTWTKLCEDILRTLTQIVVGWILLLIFVTLVIIAVVPLAVLVWCLAEGV